MTTDLAGTTNETGGKKRPCPICGKPPIKDEAPFCSKRCANVDLHRWFGGVYAVPAEEVADPDPEEDA